MRWLPALLCLVLAGCARFPYQTGPGSGPRLFFSLRTDGPIRTGLEGSGLPYVYIVALRLSTEDDPVDSGPVPVVVPAGNGFVAGNATHFILWNPLTSPAYQVYQFRDSSLNEWTQVGVPINYVDVEPGGNTLQFEVELSQLVAEVDVPNLRSVQVNFLTMNNTNTSGGGRIWDALGDGRNLLEVNGFLEVSLLQPRQFSNSLSPLEPQGDAADPALDLVDWTLEIRR